MIKQRDKTDERVEMRNKGEKEGEKSLVFYLVRMAWLTQMCRLPINHSGLRFSSSHPLHPQLRSFPLFTLLVLLPFSFLPSSSFRLPPFLCLFSLIFLFTFVSLSSLPPHFVFFLLNFYPLVLFSSSLLLTLDPSLKCVCVCTQHARSCVSV